MTSCRSPLSVKIFRSACRNLAYNDLNGPLPTGIKELTTLVYMYAPDSALMRTALCYRLCVAFLPTEFRKGGVTGRLGAGVTAGAGRLIGLGCAMGPVSRGRRSLLSNRFSGTVPVGISNLTALTTVYARAHLPGLQHKSATAPRRARRGCTCVEASYPRGSFGCARGVL